MTYQRYVFRYFSSYSDNTSQSVLSNSKPGIFLTNRLYSKMSEKVLICLRGIPSSGKTTIANKLKQQYEESGYKLTVCSADHFFTNENGEYNFDPNKLREAHQTCRSEAEAGMLRGDVVIVDNTNTVYKEIKPYLELAEQNGYNVIFVRPRNEWSDNPIKCHAITTHDVPLETIQKMHERFHSDTELRMYATRHDVTISFVDVFPEK